MLCFKVGLKILERISLRRFERLFECRKQDEFKASFFVKFLDEFFLQRKQRKFKLFFTRLERINLSFKIFQREFQYKARDSNEISFSVLKRIDRDHNVLYTIAKED